MGTNIIYNGFNFQGSGLSIPTLSINSTFNLTDGGSLIGETINISLRGQIRDPFNRPMNNSGNWSSGSTNWVGISNLVSGMEKAFSEDYKKLEILCNSNRLFTNILDNGVEKQTKVNKIEFSNRTDEYLLQILDYSIDLQIEKSIIDDERYIVLSGIYVSSIENSYTIRSSDTSEYIPDTTTTGFFPIGTSRPPYTITRKISAVGKAAEEGALNNAKSCVTGLVGKDIGFFNILSNLSITDRSTIIEADDINGSYSITDTFKSYSGTTAPTFTEIFTVSSSLDDKLSQDFITPSPILFFVCSDLSLPIVGCLCLPVLSAFF